jgi:hypothetical protein
MTGRTDSCWNYDARDVAPTYKDRPLLRRRGGPISKHVYIQERINILVTDLENNEVRTDCAGEDQQQFTRPTNRQKTPHIDKPATVWLKSGFGPPGRLDREAEKAPSLEAVTKQLDCEH